MFRQKREQTVPVYDFGVVGRRLSPSQGKGKIRPLSYFLSLKKRNRFPTAFRSARADVIPADKEWRTMQVWSERANIKNQHIMGINKNSFRIPIHLSAGVHFRTFTQNQSPGKVQKSPPSAYWRRGCSHLGQKNRPAGVHWIFSRKQISSCSSAAEMVYRRPSM